MRDNETVQQEYTGKVKNRFAVLSAESENDSTSLYQNLITANKEAAKDLIPTKCEVLSNDIRVSAAREKVNEAFTKFESNPSNINREHLQDEKNQSQINLRPSVPRGA